MSTSYRRLRRKLDQAEALLTELRADMLLLSLELVRLEKLGASVRTPALRRAREVLGEPPPRVQLELVG